MQVVKRSGRKERVSLDKINRRIAIKCMADPKAGLRQLNIDPMEITLPVVQGVHDGVRTTELDELTIRIANDRILDDTDFGELAARIAIDNHHKNTAAKLDISGRGTQIGYIVSKLQGNTDDSGNPSPVLENNMVSLILDNEELIQNHIDYSRDYHLDLFGFKTLKKSYLLKANGEVVERPQDMWMRVALATHGAPPRPWKVVDLGLSDYETSDNKLDDHAIEATRSKWDGPNMDLILKTYDAMSQGYFTLATPTLFNAGTGGGLASCNVVPVKDDSIEGIYNTLKDCALISKQAGGIGIPMSNIRASNSYIRGTRGHSNGVPAMCANTFNGTALYVDQGGNKRPGAFACGLEPWHADIFEYLDLRRGGGGTKNRARHLHYDTWNTNLFFKQIVEDGDWWLMCPDQSPGLDRVWGEEFDELYMKYVRENKYRRKVKARELWAKFCEVIPESSEPYLHSKDNVNKVNPQEHLGTVRGSNLCTEIVEYHDSKEISVCNLGSLALPKFVTPEGKFDHKTLFEMAKLLTRTLDAIIDRNLYPVPECARSNFRHRPIGIGVQGLCDVFLMMDIAFDSPEAIQLDREIFETISFASAYASWELACEQGPYPSFRFGKGSPLSRGIFHFERYGAKPSGMWDWNDLRKKIVRDGIRNSMRLAPMPTASTSQILGNKECFEPLKRVIEKRATKVGEVIIIDKFIVAKLKKLGLWSRRLVDSILEANGSIAHLTEIPADLRRIYRTAFEMGPETIIDHAIARQPWVDQSMSLNWYWAKFDPNVYSKLVLKAVKGGLKTIHYYNHIEEAYAARSTNRRVVTAPAIADATEEEEEPEACYIGCESCSG